MLMLSTAARSNNPFSELVVDAWIRFMAILLYFEALVSCFYAYEKLKTALKPVMLRLLWKQESEQELVEFAKAQ